MNIITALIKTLTQRGLEAFGKYYSSYRGFVINNDDPLSYNRLQLKVPNIYGTETMTYWAWPKGNFSGAEYGCQVLPQIGDMVWVEFELGNTRKPIWSHGHFGKPGNGAHDIQDEGKKNIQNYWFKTPGGHCIEFIDNPSQIIITSLDGPVITMDDSGINIDADGKQIFIGGAFPVLYSLVSGGVIKDVSEIGISTKIRVGE